MSVLAIDPGLRACGVALFDTEKSSDLLWAGLVKNPVEAHVLNPTYHSSIWRGMVDAVYDKLFSFHGKTMPDRLAIELPQVYVRTRSKGDPNDLIQLAGVVGAFTQRFNGMTFMYKPAEWKGQAPKDVIEARSRKCLSEEELSKIEKLPKSLAHNVWDAIALGLFHLKR